MSSTNFFKDVFTNVTDANDSDVPSHNPMEFLTSSTNDDLLISSNIDILDTNPIIQPTTVGSDTYNDFNIVSEDNSLADAELLIKSLESNLDEIPIIIEETNNETNNISNTNPNTNPNPITSDTISYDPAETLKALSQLEEDDSNDKIDMPML